MTKEEKIKGLYNLKECLVENPIELEGHKSLPITLIDYAIEALEQGTAPDKANIPKWIPVNEKLPQDNTHVLVTIHVKGNTPKVRSSYYYKNGHFRNDNGETWEATDKELVAWMPVPEAYKEIKELDKTKADLESEEEEEFERE